MDKNILNKIIEISSKDRVDLKELLSSFYAVEFVDVCDIISDFLSDNFELVYENDQFSNNYHLFLYTVLYSISDPNDILSVKSLINRNIKLLKENIKQYTKYDESKDKKYYMIAKLLTSLKGVLEFTNMLLNIEDLDEEYSIVWFVITSLKNPDYLFRLLEIHPNYANLKDSNGNHIFINIVEHYFSELDNLSDEDIRYFKRIFVMLLESDELRFKNDELFDLLELCETNMRTSNIKNKQNISFLVNEIERHYEVINGDSRVTAQDYCDIECPITIINRSEDERVDMKDKFIISIDAVHNDDLSKTLIDDAFSLEVNPDGTKLLTMYVPDVDYFVSKDSDTDMFMRSIGESVYAKGYKTPMLPYDIALEASLNHGSIRPAIAFRMKINEKGDVIDMDFKKVLINVNYNLTRHKSEIIMANNTVDPRLDILNEMYSLASILRKKRKETIGRRSKGSVIMDEFNIIPDIATANYFNDQGIVFPYKIYKGKRSPRCVEHVKECEEFATQAGLSETAKDILYSIFDIYNRVYYDIVPGGNQSYNGVYTGNVGNPMREYISLETDRLIKDLLIQGQKNLAYWEERIERDCIEHTETSAKIKQLYGRN